MNIDDLKIYNGNANNWAAWLELKEQGYDGLTGYLNAFSNGLTSLEGSPIVSGALNIGGNFLTTLEGCTKQVNGAYFVASGNKLLSVEYAPRLQPNTHVDISGNDFDYDIWLSSNPSLLEIMKNISFLKLAQGSFEESEKTFPSTNDRGTLAEVPLVKELTVLDNYLFKVLDSIKDSRHTVSDIEHCIEHICEIQFPEAVSMLKLAHIRATTPNNNETALPNHRF